MQVEFTLTGTMPLLFHADDVESSDELKDWRSASENKNVSVAGDDRSPPWTWQTYMYNDGEHVAWPSQNIMVGLRSAGSQIILKKQKTFKEITQSGLLIDREFCDFFVGDNQIPFASIVKFRDEPFRKHCELVEKLGFKLFVKRAKVGQSKHIRVRARFDQWQIKGRVMVIAKEIELPTLDHLFQLAGKIGQGDWRPGCKTPGPYGMFTAQVKKFG